jgi:hypothetical protein
MICNLPLALGGILFASNGLTASSRINSLRIGNDELSSNDGQPLTKNHVM